MAHDRRSPDPTSASIARDWWRRLSALDFESAGKLLAPDVIVEWPLTGERIRGRENVVAVNAAYPGRWRAQITRCIADGDVTVTEANVSDGDESHTAVSFFTVRDGLIQHLREFWPEPYPAPAWRQRWIEPLSSHAGEESGEQIS